MSIEYPALAPLEMLEQRHPEHVQLYPVYETIEDLSQGGYRIEAKKEKYIQKRPGEDDAIYRLRLAKFVYTPILSGCLRSVTGKVTNAAYNIAGVGGDEVSPKEAEFWAWFREHTDGSDRKERRLLSDLLLGMLKFGKVFAVIDKPAAEMEPRNRTEEEAMGLKPYVALYEPSLVYDWQVEDDLEWCKIRQIITQADPLGKRKTIIRWTFFDDEQIAVYEAVVELDKKGKITLAGTDNRKKQTVPLKQVVRHGRKDIPVVLCQLPDRLWSCKDAYLKALQYLHVENSFTDTATVAGYVQRLFKPTVKPDSIDGTMLDTDDYVEQVKSSNAHILIGDAFQFAEVSGSSLNTIRQSVLDPIKEEIESIVSMTSVSASRGKGVLQQSGLSKGYDQSEFNDAAKDFGSELCAAYQNILQQVADAAGYQPEKISVTGFDTFSLDTLDSLLAQTVGLMQFQSKLPTLALKLWFAKIVGQMHKSASAAQMEEMQAELDAIDFSNQLEPQNPDGTPALP